MYVVSSIAILGGLLFIAETFFPGHSSDLVPTQTDRITRLIFQDLERKDPHRSDDTVNTFQKRELLFPLNRKRAAGKAELVYRGLFGRSVFQIDVAILDLDPQMYYSYRFNISDAKKGFRLIDRNFKLISAKKYQLKVWQLED